MFILFIQPEMKQKAINFYLSSNDRNFIHYGLLQTWKRRWERRQKNAWQIDIENIIKQLENILVLDKLSA